MEGNRRERARSQHALRRLSRRRGLTSEGVGHPVSVQCVLELRAHEAVPISRAVEDHEMDLEDGHVDEDGHDDQAERPRDEVPHPESRADSKISQQRPELADRGETEGGDGEKSDPLARRDGAERRARGEEPLPPRLGERLLRVLVGEPDEGENGSGGKEEERGVEEDKARLSGKGVLEEDEKGTEE